MPDSKDKQRDAYNDRLDEMRQSGIEATRRWLSIWEDGLNYVYDNQLAGKKIKDGWDPIVANHIFPAMMQEMALISQRNTTVIPQAVDPGDLDSVTLWQRHLQWLADTHLKFQDFLLSAALDGKIYGHYIAMPHWEPRHHWDMKKRQWVGMPAISLLKPQYFGADPECENIDQASFAFSRRRVDREWAKAKWHDYADLIEEVSDSEDVYRTEMSSGGMHLADPGGAKDTEQNHHIGQLAAILSQGWTDSAEYTTSNGRSRYITVEQFLIRDPVEKKAEEKELIPYEELLAAGKIIRDGDLDIDRETGKLWHPRMTPERIKRSFSEPTFPFGRIVMRIGDQILNTKEEDQIWPYRRWPFVIGLNHLLPHTWQGLNGVIMAQPMQDWINISYSHLLNCMKWFGDPVTVVEEGAVAGADNNRTIAQKIKNAAGKMLVVVKGAINRVRREPPPSPGVGVIQVLNKMVEELNDATGMQDIGLGKAGSRVTATEAARLETNTKMRQALGNKLLDSFTIRCFEHLSEICQAQYTAEDWVRMAGEDQRPVAMQVTQRMKDMELDLRIKVGTDLPFDKERKQQNYLSVFNSLAAAQVNPVIMLPELLSAFDIDEKQQILSRVEIWQRIQAEAQKAIPGQEGQAAEVPPEPGQPAQVQQQPTQPGMQTGIGGAMPEVIGIPPGGIQPPQPQ